MTIVLLTLTTTATMAQDPEGWDDNSSADTPVDGGLSLLIAAGASYGIKKLRQRRSLPDHQGK